MSINLYRDNRRSARILSLVENVDSNKIEDMEKSLEQENENSKCESPLPPNCKLTDAEFAILESMIDEDLSRDATISPVVIQSEPVHSKNLDSDSEASIVLDSNENTPVPSPIVDFESGSSLASAFCYMWTECTAKRGANEVSSCLMHFIKCKVEMGAKTFLFWSDNCSGQNRNRVVYSIYMLMSQKYNIDITHRFLEQGHTQNEGDSVHALIEREAKGKLIYTPDQWYALVRWAKVTGNPYNVIEMTQDDIFDMKVDKQWKKDTANRNVSWNSLKEIKAKKEDPNCLYLKYNLNGDSHCSKTLQGTRRGKRATRNVEIKNLYSDILPLPEAKYKDLMSLCNSGVIPKEYQRFFQNLKHGENLPDENDDSN